MVNVVNHPLTFASTVGASAPESIFSGMKAKRIFLSVAFSSTPKTALR